MFPFSVENCLSFIVSDYVSRVVYLKLRRPASESGVSTGSSNVITNHNGKIICNNILKQYYKAKKGRGTFQCKEKSEERVKSRTEAKKGMVSQVK